MSVELDDRLAGVRTRALDGVSFSLHQGECVAVLGSNGAGKSTLLLAAAGALPAVGGRITLDGEPYDGSLRSQRRIRRLVGVALQFPERGFFGRSVREEVTFVAARAGGPDRRDGARGRQDGRRLEEAAVEALARVGMPPSYLERSPYELSGGEKRLVALAAAVAHQPRYLLLDEPEVGLDHRALGRVQDLLRRFAREGGGALVVTHDVETALAWADRFLLLEQGRVAGELAAGDLARPEAWALLERWLWDRGRLGRAHAAARRAGADVPSPYVEPQRCLEWVVARGT